MYTILLFVHILLALLTLVSSLKVVIDVRRRSAQSKRGLLSMWISFGGVMTSGVGLIVAVPMSLGHACVLMSLYVMVVTGVQLYQKHAPKIA